MSRTKFEYDQRTAYSRRKTYGAWTLVRDALQILASVWHRSHRPDGSGQLIHPEVSVMQTRVYRTGGAGHKVGEQGSYDHWVLVNAIVLHITLFACHTKPGVASARARRPFSRPRMEAKQTDSKEKGRGCLLQLTVCRRSGVGAPQRGDSELKLKPDFA